MPERLIDLTERQLEILGLLMTGEMKLVEFEAVDADHLVILKNRGLAEVYMSEDDRVSARLTRQGARLAVAASIRRKRAVERLEREEGEA